MELRSCFNSTSNSTAVGSEKIAPAVVLGLCCLVGLPSNIAVIISIARDVHRYHNVIKSRITNRMILQRLERRHRHLQLIGIWILAFAFSLPVIFTQGLKDKNGLQRFCKNPVGVHHPIFDNVDMLSLVAQRIESKSEELQCDYSSSGPGTQKPGDKR
ncbi:hypothetical protein M9458_036336 [Cirrhinus mrigala]|uniref:G-protein coupled receptors family 1 profile domain-containing protein n=1 Tax=Cirrhinus mrigala TaxID=683832 RepID=A0ABD0P250_CIRMR